MNKSKYFTPRVINIISVVVTIVEKDKVHLKKCLKSLEKSAEYARINLKIIILCNGTIIHKPSYLKSKFIIIHNKKNVGVSQALNKGMKISSTKWCIILNPDTIVKKNTLKILIKSLYKSNIAILVPKIFTRESLDFNIIPPPSVRSVFLEQSYLYKSFFSLFKLPNSDNKYYDYTHEIDAAASSFWLIKRKCFWKVGGFDPSFFLYFNDADLCRRLRAYDYKILYVDDAHIIHLGQQSSRGIIRGDLFFDGLERYSDKYYSLYYKNLIILFFLVGSTLRLIYWFIRKNTTINSDVKNFINNKMVYYIRVIVAINKYISSSLNNPLKKLGNKRNFSKPIQSFKQSVMQAKRLENYR